MKRFLAMALGLCSLAAAAAVQTQPAPIAALSAEQIVERNLAARGGADAWRAITTLRMTGKLEAGSKQNPGLSYVMAMKRPHKSRLEINFQDQTALQVYDGTQGWKLRPFLGRNDVEPYSPQEAKAASDWEELDGPLVDYAKKGTGISLIGTEAVEGHDAYKLKLTRSDGVERNLWIDAHSFLELKIDGEPRKMDGVMRNVAVYYRDYRAENGLMVPHVLETVVDNGSQGHKMFIEHWTFNAPMDDALFARPQSQAVKAARK
jgi:outer membrane lipoprotein-sorting protein